MRKALFGTLFFFGMQTSAFSGGIPVFDAANVAQAILDVKNGIEQLQSLRDQYLNMVEELQTAKETLESMTGPRGFANIISSTYSQSTHADVSGILSQFKIKDANEWGLPPELAALYDAANSNAAWYYGNSEATLDTAKDRLISLARLVGAVDGTEDQKDVLDLSTRTEGEATLLQNEQVKLNALKARAEAHDAMMERQRVQAFLEVNRSNLNRAKIERWMNTF